MSLERQSTFGWPVASDTFLSSTGAGIFLVSFLLGTFDKYTLLTSLGTLVGALLVLAAVLLLAADLTIKSRFYRVFFNPSSWMTRGSWILTAFIIFSLAYSLPSLQPFAWLPWSQATLSGQIIGIVAALLSLMVIIYPGLLLGSAKSIPLWNTPALPTLFLFSGLTNGIAVLFLIALPLSGGGQEMGTALRPLTGGQIGLILTQFLMIGVYVEIAKQGSIAATEAIRNLLRTPVFIAGVLVIGLIVPLILLLYGIALTDNILALLWLAAVAGILLLTGGILLRYAIIRLGIYLPLRA